MQRTSLIGIAAPVALLLLAAAPAVFSDDHDKKTDITIEQPIQVPGAVLQPGTYMFILMNSSSDRHIVEIKSEDGSKLYATTFTTAARRVEPTGKVVLTFYEMPAGTPQALRQWFWPGDTEGQEFLYPHDKAAEITAATNQTVPEVPADQDTAQAAPPAPAASDSANLAAAAPAPAPEPAADQPSQQAVVEQPIQSDNAPAAPVNEAQVTQAQVTQAPEDTPVADPGSNNTLAQNTPPAPVVSQPPAATQVASDSNSITSLPQTASDLPLVGLFGLVFLTSGVTMMLARRS